MLGRTPGNIVAVSPLHQGVISDFTVTEKMLEHFIRKAVGKKTFRKPKIAVCVPSGVTEVEKKAVEDATYQAGAREVMIIEEPIAAAIGAGIDISRPCGNMIVDIGGGTSDIAVISLGGAVVSTSVKIAGDDFDEAIVRYMRKKHNLLIGERTAEDIKIKDVTWKTDYKEDSTAGKYTFTAQITDDYKLAKDVVLPKLTIEITEAQTKTTEKQPETKAAETKQPETKATEAKKPETKTTEKTPEVKKPETKVTEKETEVRKPETKATEKKPETKISEKQPETKADAKENHVT